MTNQLELKPDISETIESVVIGGDLSKLTPADRVSYYKAVCQSVGLNPLTRPFDYITLNSRLTLYARKDATDQLRNINHISIGKPDIQFEDDWIVVTVVATDQDGRTDSDVGVVKKTDMRGNFGNALMKAVTKAKRRVTLSICGLGMLDETEVETIPDATFVELDEPLQNLDNDHSEEEEQDKNKPTSNGTVYDAVVEAGYFKNEHNAINAFRNYCKTGYDTIEKAMDWSKAYRAWRDSDATPQEAGDKANAGELPK